MDSLNDLAEVLRESQRLGFLGSRPVDQVIEHARAFVRALDDLEADASVLDLGTGGGVPGLVIAHDRPDLRVTLLDRRTKRTDFLERVVRRLGWRERVSVAASDAADFAVRHPHEFDVVVARGFGPPDETVLRASALAADQGQIVISEPPAGDRWAPELLEQAGVARSRSSESTVAIFVRT